LRSGIGEIPAFLQAFTAQGGFRDKITVNVQLFVPEIVKLGATA
jgi:hypothetical protein